MLPRAVLLALESQSPDTSEQCTVKARQEYIWTLRCLHTFHKCLGTLKFWITAYHKILLLLTSSWGLFSKCCVPIKYFRFCLPKKMFEDWKEVLGLLPIQWFGYTECICWGIVCITFVKSFILWSLKLPNVDFLLKKGFLCSSVVLSFLSKTVQNLFTWS